MCRRSAAAYVCVGYAQGYSQGRRGILIYHRVPALVVSKIGVEGHQRQKKGRSFSCTFRTEVRSLVVQQMQSNAVYRVFQRSWVSRTQASKQRSTSKQHQEVARKMYSNAGQANADTITCHTSGAVMLCLSSLLLILGQISLTK